MWVGDKMNKGQKNIIVEKSMFPVMPLINYSKIPLFPWSKDEYLIKNVDELEEISEVYKREVEGKIRGGQINGFFLLTGACSDIMVLDIDKNHGDCSINGEENFKELISDLSEDDKRQIADTFAVRTPNGGIHLYFKYKNGLKNKPNYVPGVDIRTDGGLIVLPNSMIRIEKKIIEYKVCNDNEILDMPQTLFNKLMKLDNPKVSKESLNIVSYNDTKKFVNSKYYKIVEQGGRDDTLISWLGLMIKQNQSLRTKENLLPHAHMYNECYLRPPLSDEEVQKKVESVLNYALPPYCDENGKVDNWELANHILKSRPSYTKGNLWFLYDDERGYYQYMDSRKVQAMFLEYPLNSKEKTVGKAKAFADLLLLASEDAGDIYDEKRYINCLNGVIDTKNDVLVKHNSNYKLELQFKANYIENWEELFEKSKFKKYLFSTLDEDSINTLQESWGLMLSPHAKEVQNCFIYKGEGANGKSLAFEIQEALIGGNQHICSIGLGDFGGEFVVASAEGKHVNIVRDDELSGKTVNKAFKSMCCGEPVQVNRKSKDIVRLGFNITMFFGVNRMPKSDDNSLGFFRRPIIIPFNNSFGTEEEVDKGIRDKVKDPDLANKIINNELDIVLMWSYQGYKRVRDNNWKVSVSKASQLESEEYRKEQDTAYAFKKEKIKELPKGTARISKKDLFEEYENWCGLNGIRALDIGKFGKQLGTFGIKGFVSNSVRYWLDIEVIS